MADFRTMLTDPLTVLGASMMAGSDPNRTGLGGIGEALLGTGQYIHAQDQAAIEQQRYAEEQARARQMADLQMQLIRSRIAGGGQPKTGMNPIWFMNPENNQLEVGQLTEGGPVYFPETGGRVPIKPTDFLNIGSGYAPVGYGATAPTAPIIPMGIDPAQMPGFKQQQAVATAAGGVAGKSMQEAAEQLPGAMLDAQRTLSHIGQIRSHPALASATGWSSLAPTLLGSDKADFLSRMNQLTSGAFLMGFQALKGGGNATELEGQKAEQSIARMQTATNEKDFLSALSDYEDAVQTGIKKLQLRARQAPVGVEAPRAPGIPKTPTPGEIPVPVKETAAERRKRIDSLVDYWNKPPEGP